MRTLSPETEQRILTAMSAAAAEVGNGAHPNDAIAKAAVDAQLRPGHINLMVHAYNTARAAQQRERGADVFDKAADFTLADAGQILERLYPSEVKTAAAKQAATVISPEYQQPPSWARRPAELTKQAALAPMVAPPAPLRNERNAVKEAFDRRQRNDRQIEAARARATGLQYDAGLALGAVADYFKTAGHLPFGDALREVEHCHGTPGVAVLKQVAHMLPKVAKEAATNVLRSRREPIHGLVATVLEKVAAYQTAQAAYLKTENELGRDTEAALRPFVQGPSRYILEAPSSKTAIAPAAAGAKPLTWGVTGAMVADQLQGMLGRIAPRQDDEELKATMDKLTDPQHEAELRNIRTQAMLQNLMTNDQVVSGYDPDDVLTAFNEIGQLSPRAVDQPLVMQSLLRKRLSQGHIDPFDADQLLGIDSKLKDNSGATSYASKPIL